MRRTLILLPGLVLLLAACQQDSAGYDDAMAQCEAAATEAMEAADPQPDQRATWREQHVRECMEGKGFSG
ncbi:MAG TPA: hypothetical protein VFV80_06565 [Geminicoccaceae bacterium]|nr:hypothetical protein [Geminicoccaceae bacterium]